MWQAYVEKIENTEHKVQDSDNSRKTEQLYKCVLYSFCCVVDYIVFVVLLVFEPYPYVTNIFLCVIFNLEDS